MFVLCIICICWILNTDSWLLILKQFVEWIFDINVQKYNNTSASGWHLGSMISSTREGTEEKLGPLSRNEFFTEIQKNVTFHLKLWFGGLWRCTVVYCVVMAESGPTAITFITFLARDVIYKSRAYPTMSMSICLSVCLSVCLWGSALAHYG